MLAENFILGTHEPSWLADERFANVPLMVSDRRLREMKRLPRARGYWALDSGGFTELQLFGGWMVAIDDYIARVRRYIAEVGGLMWAAGQDWMCEGQVLSGLVERRPRKPCPACTKAGRTMVPSLRVAALDADERPTFACPCGFTVVGNPPRIPVGPWRAWAVKAGAVMARAVADADRLGMEAVVVFHGTGLTVAEHLARTVENFVELRARAPEVPWLPTLQGWTRGDYIDCLELYERAGVDLRRERLVGVGTMCRRESTTSAGMILRWLADEGLVLHGFGFKKEGVRQHGDVLFSSDSLAWSDHARHEPPLEGHNKPGPGRPQGHARCNNCPDFALEWYSELCSELLVAA